MTQVLNYLPIINEVCPGNAVYDSENGKCVAFESAACFYCKYES